ADAAEHVSDEQDVGLLHVWSRPLPAHTSMRMQTRLPWKRPRTGPPKGAEDDAHGGNGADGTRDRAGDGEAPITNGGAVRDVERSQDPPPVDGDPPPARADPATG